MSTERSPISLRRTLVGGLAVLLAAGLARTLAMLATASLVGADLESADPALRRDGLLLGIGLLAGSIAGAAVLAFVARPPRRVLALERPTGRALVLWLVAGVALSGALDLAAWLTNRPLVDPSWVDAYRTGPPALLAVALVVASIFEELYFRGLLQGRLATTRVGPFGAIAIVAVLFSLVHFPGDGWRFAEVLAAAVLLGVARHATGSTIPGMLPHVLGNLKVLAVLAWTS